MRKPVQTFEGAVEFGAAQAGADLDFPRVNQPGILFEARGLLPGSFAPFCHPVRGARQRQHLFDHGEHFRPPVLAGQQSSQAEHRFERLGQLLEQIAADGTGASQLFGAEFERLSGDQVFQAMVVLLRGECGCGQAEQQTGVLGIAGLEMHIPIERVQRDRRVVLHRLVQFLDGLQPAAFAKTTSAPQHPQRSALRMLREQVAGFGLQHLEQGWGEGAAQQMLAILFKSIELPGAGRGAQETFFIRFLELVAQDRGGGFETGQSGLVGALPNMQPAQETISGGSNRGVVGTALGGKKQNELLGQFHLAAGVEEALEQTEAFRPVIEAEAGLGQG